VANAVFFFMQKHDDPNVVNIGYGTDVTIAELAKKIAVAAGFHGRIEWDVRKPDGMYRKLMDSSKARALGWKPMITLEEGIERTVREYRSLIHNA
jgi:GDP-L-fucose synthase